MHRPATASSGHGPYDRAVALTETQVKYPASIPLPERFDGENIVLRPWRVDDAPALFDAIRESMDRLRPWLPWTHLHPCVDATRQYIAGCVGKWATRADLVLSIWDHAETRLLGATGLHPPGGGTIDWALRSFEIGYWLRTSEEGRGRVAEAVRFLTRWAFEDLDAARVIIRCDPRNERSWRVAERAGYRLEGTARSVVRSGAGEVQDLRVYALVAADRARQTPDARTIDGSAASGVSTSGSTTESPSVNRASSARPRGHGGPDAISS
jgi:ribosomal-protein-serine acetyltransferase